ncbi:12998_t:CDS:1, partial [Gigaspora margarita]
LPTQDQILDPEGLNDILEVDPSPLIETLLVNLEPEVDPEECEFEPKSSN